MRDIQNKISSQNFPRVRVGSGKPKINQDLADYVLSGFSKDETEAIEQAIEKAKNAVIEILDNGISEAMNKYN